jgi:hypothetical protein
VKDGNAIKYKQKWVTQVDSNETLYVDLPCEYNMSNGVFDMTKRITFQTPFTDGFEDDPEAFHDFLPVQEWLESEIDLVCETQQVRQWYFSEKTCRPLGHCKPFLVIGGAGWYKIFEKLGFKLYDELFDYSFDEIESFRYRHEAIMTQIKDILDMNKMLKDLRHAMETQFRYKFYNSTEFPFLQSMGIRHILQGFEAPPQIGFIGILHLWWTPEESGIVYKNPRTIVAKGTWKSEWFDSPEDAVEIAQQIQADKPFNEDMLIEAHMKYHAELQKKNIKSIEKIEEEEDIVYN